MLADVLGFTSALLLVGAAIGAVYGWVASLFEVAKVRELDPSVFGAGPVVLRFDLLDLPPHAATREPSRVSGGRFRVLSNGRILFVPRVYLPIPGLSLLNFGLFKGSIDRIDGVPRVSARATVGGTTLVASFGIAAAVLVLLPISLALFDASACRLTVDGTPVEGAPACRVLALLAWVPFLLFGGTAWGVYRTMQRRARRLALEIRARIVEASAGRVSA